MFFFTFFFKGKECGVMQPKETLLIQNRHIHVLHLLDHILGCSTTKQKTRSSRQKNSDFTYRRWFSFDECEKCIVFMEISIQNWNGNFTLCYCIKFTDHSFKLQVKKGARTKHIFYKLSLFIKQVIIPTFKSSSHATKYSSTR